MYLKSIKAYGFKSFADKIDIELNNNIMINDEEQTPISKENVSYNIEENSDEWKRVEFHLKSSIPSEIKITKIISVKNTNSLNQFEYLSNNHQKNHCNLEKYKFVAKLLNYMGLKLKILQTFSQFGHKNII